MPCVNPMRFAVVALLLALSAVPGGVAGPACAHRHKSAQNCVSLCASRWGWPGSAMGTDRWGTVMHPTGSESAGTILSSACGASSSSALSPSAEPSVTTSSSSLAPSASLNSSSSFTSIPSTTFVTSTTIVTPSSQPDTSSVSSSEPSSSEPTSSAPPTTSTFESSSLPTPTPTTSSTESQSSSSSSSEPITTTSSEAPSSTPSSTSGSGGTSSADINSYLSAHNTVRSQHGASPLTWSDDLASKAQQWADGCVFQHSGGSLGPFGENLAAGTGDSYDIATAIKSWTDESSSYDPNNPQASHFTQVVWKATTQVGCALQMCSGIFAASFGLASFYVCEYSPQGNVIGQFPQNVQV